MRIKKTSQYIEGGASISNVYGTSQENGYSQEYINGLNTYSTSEIDTGKVWIDGKNIYRKVIDCGALPNNTSKSVSTGITTSINLINISGLAYNSSNYYITLPFVHTTTIGTQCSLRFDGSTTGSSPNSVILIAGSDMSSYTSSFVIIEYTKN